MSSTRDTRVSPKQLGLAHQEQEDGRVVFYDPDDSLETMGARWISAEATLNVVDMR